MTKKEMLDVLRLLSALESWSLSRNTTSLPDYLHDDIINVVEKLEKYILGEGNE